MEFINIIIYLSIYLGLFATSFYILSFIADRKKQKQLFTDDELPTVTVIIPAYNEEKSIARTIQTILKSGYPSKKFDIIVVDDGSKDNTYSIAKKFESSKVRVFTKKNGGKGSALNYGIERAEGEFVITMDADTHAEPQSMKEMVRFFKDPEVMGVTPAMLVHNPKSVLQRIQHIEYLLGLFMRKAFASVNAIFITPGAFSAYRKSFFDKYGGYDVGNITEDLEIALRIQLKGYKIANCPDAPVYTLVPATFKSVLIQRRRWYFGLIKNMINYRKMISPKYGDMGAFVIPIAWISIFFAVFVTTYLFIKTLFDIKKELLFLQSVDFDFSGITDINYYTIERFLFLFFSKPAVLFILVFACLLGGYLYYAAKKVGKTPGLVINLPLFFLFFAILFGIWWVVSICYAIFAKSVRWR